jgi:hypothetical protein
MMMMVGKTSGPPWRDRIKKISNEKNRGRDWFRNARVSIFCIYDGFDILTGLGLGFKISSVACLFLFFILGIFSSQPIEMKSELF